MKVIPVPDHSQEYQCLIPTPKILISVPVTKYRECDFLFLFTFPKVGDAIFHSHYKNLGMGTGMKIAFPTFGNGNETLVFPGMVGNWNGNDFWKSNLIWNVVPKRRGAKLNSTFCSKLYIFSMQISRNYVMGPKKISS